MNRSEPELRPQTPGEDPESSETGAPDPFALSDPDTEDAVSEGTEKQKRSKTERSFWRELPVLIIVALVVAVVIKTFVVQAFFIPSGSMKETLQINDRVLVNKLAYRIGDVSRGDVIVFDDPRGGFDDDDESTVGALIRNLAESVGLSTPKSEFIKRVIALPGETIQIEDGTLMIDGVPLVEDYLQPLLRMPDFGPETVPPDFMFVMGDNRNSSQDSRFFGPIPMDDVVGKAFTIIWPPSNWTGL